MSRFKSVAGCGTAAILWAAVRAVACPTVDSCSPSACVVPESLSLGATAAITHGTTGGATGGTIGATIGGTTGGAQTLGLPRTPPPSPGAMAITIVHLFNFAFSINPNGDPIVDPTINVGDTLRFQWDSGFHSATSVAGSPEAFNSGDSFPPFNFDHTFTQAGVFWYFCDIHGFDNGDGTASGMAGKVTVNAPSSSWIVDFDSSWNTASNWNNSIVPNAAGYVATLGPVISGPRGITVDSSVTIGTLNIDSPAPKSYLIAGSATMSLAGAGGSATGVNVNSGTHTITAKLSVVNNATFNIAASSQLNTTQLQTTTASITKTGAGKLIVNNVRAGALNINAGEVAVQTNGSSTGTSRVTTLSLDSVPTPTSKLDLMDNDLIVTSGSEPTIRGWIRNARNGGAWDQPGITSSTAKNDGNHDTTLGAMTGADYKSANGATATFDGFAVANADVLVKYTYYGDSDFNGKVDGADYARIDTTFNNETATHTDIGGWLNGDFDDNGKVDGSDYALIDGAFNSQGAALRPIGTSVGYFDFVGPMPPPGMSTVPEPATSLLFAGLTVVSLRRSRRA